MDPIFQEVIRQAFLDKGTVSAGGGGRAADAERAAEAVSKRSDPFE